MSTALSKLSRRRLLAYFNALEDDRFVDCCLDLLHRGVDLQPFFRGSEFLYSEVVEAGLETFSKAQTGEIYLAANPVYPNNLYKLGKTRKSAEARRHSLKTAGVLGQFVMVGRWPTLDIDRSETRCHQLLAHFRVDGEFFHLDFHAMTSAVQRVLIEEDRAFALLRELAFER